LYIFHIKEHKELHDKFLEQVWIRETKNNTSIQERLLLVFHHKATLIFERTL